MDCVERKAVIDLINVSTFDLYDSDENWIMQDRVWEPPSVQPERKMGKWIEYTPEHGKCPFCGERVDLLDGRMHNFCGECGADMRQDNHN